MNTDKSFIPLSIDILVVSDTRTVADDTSGKTLVERATEAGHHVIEKKIVPDNIYRSGPLFQTGLQRITLMW
jgi:molybdenum cofactor biosynthesis protein B